MALKEKLRYKIDLRRYMADCDANYYRLLRLFPGLKLEGETKLELGGRVDSPMLVLTVLENTPYTTLVRLVQPLGRTSKWLANSGLTVRLYHDARTSEVWTCGSRARVLPRYGYPNGRMYQPDEKAQWNRFLSELLNYCLEFGRSSEPVFP